MIRLIIVAAFAVLLAGCNVAFTDRYELASDGSVTVRLIEALDDQMYQLAQSQADASSLNDPFRVAASGAWTLTRSVTADDLHVVETSRHFDSLGDAGVGIRTLLDGARSSSSMPGPSPAAIENLVHSQLDVGPNGFFKSREHLHVLVHPLSANTDPGNSDPWAAMGKAMVASMVTLRTEISVPNGVVESNGERLPDGSYRWTHPLNGPSTIDLVVETPDVPHVAGACAVAGLLLLSLLAWVVAARRARATTEAMP